MFKRNARIAAVFLALLCSYLYLNSATLFRFKMASFYVQKKNYIRAISIYSKIIRKESLKTSSREYMPGPLSRAIFMRGSTYSISNMSNKAIEEFIKAINSYPGLSKILLAYAKLPREYLTLGTAFLEIGSWDLAIQSFSQCPNCAEYKAEISQFISIAEKIKSKSITRNLGDDLYLSIGGAYIENKMWDTARAFFTKRALTRIAPIKVLEYLDRKYNHNDAAEIKQKTWGKNIYVSLEDFEVAENQLYPWPGGDTKPVVNRHKISSIYASKGNCAELIDLTYKRGGDDYWAKVVNLPVSTSLRLGIRLFIKSQKPFGGYMTAHVDYPKQKMGSTWYSDRFEMTKDGWQVRFIDNFCQQALSNGYANGWNTDEAKIDGIIIDTKGISNKIYVDEIELYIE